VASADSKDPEVSPRDLPVRCAPHWGACPVEITFEEVADIAVGEDDRVYVLTRADARILIFRRDGTFVESIGEGADWQRPHGITVGPHGTLFVVDEERHQILELGAEGELLRTVGSGTRSATGHVHGSGSLYTRLSTIERSAGPFNRPTKLAFGERAAYVADGYGNAAIHEFTVELDYVRTWGRPGTGPGEFHLPHSLVVDPDGRVIVADRENDRIQVFAANGTFIAQWTDTVRPSVVALTPHGNILCAEMARFRGESTFRSGDISTGVGARFSLFDRAGKLLDRWHTEGEGADGTSLIAPHGMAFGSRGELYLGQVTATVSRLAGVCVAGYPALQKFDASGL
jgi:hypothetical protein